MEKYSSDEESLELSSERPRNIDQNGRRLDFIREIDDPWPKDEVLGGADHTANDIFQRIDELVSCGIKSILRNNA